MKNKSQTFSTRIVMLVMAIVMVLPVSAFAQGRGRNNDRWDRNDRNDRWGRNDNRVSFQLRQTALNAGYNNGMEEGRKDRRRGERFEFRDESDYQRATEDYSSRLGDRELYRRFFREGFSNGYRAGFAGY